jgi:hypothetical protein
MSLDNIKIDDVIDSGKYILSGFSLRYGIAGWRLIGGLEQAYGNAKMQSTSGLLQGLSRDDHPIVNDDYRAKRYYAGFRWNRRFI